MGQSGAGGGGGGSGGAGGAASSGARGGGGGGYDKPRSPKKGERDAAQRVLARLKPAYLERHYIGAVVPGLVRDLVLMGVDLRRGGNWRALCQRLQLSDQASLDEVRDAMFERNAEREHDQRILGASRSAPVAFFEELTLFDDDLLSKRRIGATWSARIDQTVTDRTLTKFLTLLTENVLLREEPHTLPPSALDGLRAMAEARAETLTVALRKRYQGSGDAGDARLLERAGGSESERAWFVDALRG